MSDREILDKYVDLEKSCLSDSERKQVMDILYKYKDTFSLRYEVGTFPNIEVEIDVKTNHHSSLCHIMLRGEDRNILDRKMKRLCYLDILKEVFSAYSSPVMLSSRKVTKEKRVVTDFRHLNVRIAENNLAYPLLNIHFQC